MALLCCYSWNAHEVLINWSSPELLKCESKQDGHVMHAVIWPRMNLKSSFMIRFHTADSKLGLFKDSRLLIKNNPQCYRNWERVCSMWSYPSDHNIWVALLLVTLAFNLQQLNQINKYTLRHGQIKIILVQSKVNEIQTILYIIFHFKYKSRPLSTFNLLWKKKRQETQEKKQIF